MFTGFGSLFREGAEEEVMAEMSVDFCGVKFKNPVVIASLETTNSPDLMRQCFDGGASGVIIKTLTDIEDMARLTENSKYCVLTPKAT